jgi:hypothetical protein
MKLIRLENESSACTPSIASLGPNKIMALCLNISYPIIVPVKKLVYRVFHCLLEIVPTNCTNEKNAEEKNIQCFLLKLTFSSVYCNRIENACKGEFKLAIVYFNE